MLRKQKSTQKANNALNFAIESAQEFGHNYIGTEHIVLGLLREATSMASVVLNKQNNKLKKLLFVC